MADIYGSVHTRSTGGNYVDIVEDLSSAIRYGNLYEVPFYANLPVIGAIDTTHKWTTDAPHTLTGSMNTILKGSAGATTLTATALTYDHVRVGHILRVASEWMRVTAVSSTAVTVTRGYAGTTRTTHATTTTFTIVDDSHAESSTGTAHSTVFSEVTNQCQIFKNIIQMSRTRRGVTSVAGDVWAHQTLKQMKEHARMIERALLHGKIGTATANTSARHSRGIVDAISTTRHTTTTSITATRLNNFFRAIDEAGGNPSVILADGVAIQHINELNLGYINVGSFDMDMATLGGIRATRWVSPWGVMALMPCRQLGSPIGATGNLVALTWEECKLAVIDDGKYEPLGKTGDFDQAQIVSELCLEWGNENYHGVMLNHT
ncbi:MAG TPA: DUF5309 family protein [Acidobacteriota bacterium]|nr:DUF5309 family protein [Acidobacteriota bacterium]